MKTDELYHYRYEQRIRIGTTNIIDYIGIIAELILRDEDIPNQDIALAKLDLVIRLILKNGEKIFPFWSELTMKI